MTRKVYLGEYAMPHEIEVTAHAFYEAIKNCGYNSGGVDACPELESCNVRVATFHDEGVESTSTELCGGKWQRVGWVDCDE